MPRCSIRVFDTPYLAAAAGDGFIDGVSEFGARLAGVAAGRSMQPVYDHLVSAEARSSGLFSKTTFVQLDEVALAVRCNTSFSDEEDRHLLSRLSGGYLTFLVINGQTNQNYDEAIRHRAAILKNGGLGVELLGISVNGHVGFNEHGCEPDSRCRITELTMSTLERNGYPSGTRVITLGIAEIMSAQRIIILAKGAAKSPAATAMIEGPKSGACPASLLRGHPNLTLPLDRAAAKNFS